MWRCLSLASWLAVVSACQFERPPNIDPTDARDVDAVDAPPPCTPSTTVCDDAAGVYTECDAAGAVVRQLTCPLGCATDTEQCLDIDPHNGLATYLDMVADPPDVVLAGPATIDPATGLVFDNGLSIPIPTFVTAGGVRVFVTNSLSVSGPLTVSPTSSLSHPIAVVSHGDIVIHALIDVSARLDRSGPGGWPGNDPQHSQSDDCIGRPVFAGPPSPGGGGGGGATAGAAGGAANAAAGGVPGVAQADFEPLHGGCAGGGSLVAGEAFGGGGGGGLQLSSRTAIRIESAGGINASGGGGVSAGLSLGGTGGGSGGNILIEAPQVVLSGAAVVISTKGGGGGGASSSTAAGGPGGDGGLNAVPAAGGSSPVGDIGGRGAVDGAPEPGGDASGGNNSGGGGGGAMGTVLFATRAGTIVPLGGAAVRGQRQDEALRTRHVP